jgi:hypothetical protein
VSGRRLTVEPVERGPSVSHNGVLTIAAGHEVGGGWRVIVGVTPAHDVRAGDLVTADFDASDIETIIEALTHARDDAIRSARGDA